MVFLIFLLLIAACALVSGYVLMILMGALGHIFGVEWMFISFWEAVVVGIALSVIAGYFKKGNS